MADVSIYDRKTILIIRLPARFDAVLTVLEALGENYSDAYVTYDTDGNMAVIEGADETDELQDDSG